jgi:hypothetical protein
MTRTSKSTFTLDFIHWLRRVFGRYVRELGQTGRVVRTLWDAAQMQAQQRAHYRKLGEIALELYKQQKIPADDRIERLEAKIQQTERILTRQELLLRSYQQKSDIREVLRDYRRENQDRLDKLEPV